MFSIKKLYFFWLMSLCIHVWIHAGEFDYILSDFETYQKVGDASGGEKDKIRTKIISELSRLIHTFNSLIREPALSGTEIDQAINIAAALGSNDLVLRLQDAQQKENSKNAKYVSGQLVGIISEGVAKGADHKQIVELLLNTQDFDPALLNASVNVNLTPFREKVTDDVLATITKIFPNLRRLKLAYCQKITANGYQHLSALNNLTHLNLAGNDLGDDTVQKIIALPNMKNVVSLNLASNKLGDKTVEALTKSTDMQNLTSLNLNINRITEKGGFAIADSPNFINLKRLSLKSSSLGFRGASAIANSRNLPALSRLNLAGNNIGDMGARAIAESRQLQNLIVLTLSNNHISSSGAEAIARSTNLNSLIGLNLGNNEIDYYGAKDIGESSNLKSLKELNLRNNDIGGYREVYEIRELPKMKNLTLLDLTNNDKYQHVTHDPNDF